MTASLEAGYRPRRRRHHEHDARGFPEGAAALRSGSRSSRPWRARRRRARTPGTTPAPAMRRFCELNYTPSATTAASTFPRRSRSTPSSTCRGSSGRTSSGKARSPTPESFIHPVPHMSFVHGADRVAFLKKRHAALTAHHCYFGMEYTEDKKQLAEWAPLVMEGRDPGEADRGDAYGHRLRRQLWRADQQPARLSEDASRAFPSSSRSAS